MPFALCLVIHWSFCRYIELHPKNAKQMQERYHYVVAVRIPFSEIAVFKPFPTSPALTPCLLLQNLHRGMYRTTPLAKVYQRLLDKGIITLPEQPVRAHAVSAGTPAHWLNSALPCRPRRPRHSPWPQQRHASRQP